MINSVRLADIDVQGLFLNADSGFDTNDLHWKSLILLAFSIILLRKF